MKGSDIWLEEEYHWIKLLSHRTILYIVIDLYKNLLIKDADNVTDMKILRQFINGKGLLID